MLEYYRKHIHNIGFIVYCIFCILAFIDGINTSHPFWALFFYGVTPFILVPFTFGKYQNVKIQGYILSFFLINLSFLTGFFRKNIGMNQANLLAVACLSSFYHIVGINYFEMVYIIFCYILFYTFAPYSMFNNNSIEFSNFILQNCFLFAGQLMLISNIKIHLKTHSALEERSLEAEIASKAKGDFLANMSHEIRTPMNAISGIAELILRENISNEVREFVLSIKSASSNLITIINDILDFSKIESGKLELSCGEYEPMSLLNDIINIILTRINDKNIEFIINIDPNIPNKLIGDEIRIKQIIINLLNNAVKFTEKGAVILNIYSRYTENNNINLNVSVEDTGIGIKPENIEKLFGSFYQVNTRKNRNIEGTGLGLAISKQLITLMHGFINVKSTYNKGSVFSFVIPQPVTDNTPGSYLKEPEKYNILLFETNPYTCTSLERLFKQLNVKFTSCTEESNFLSCITKPEYSHLFIDYNSYLIYKEALCSLQKSLEIVVMYNRNKNIKLTENIKFLCKPIYCLPVVSILSNTHINGILAQSQPETIQFTAPKANILVVDDNEVNLRVAIGLLKPYKMTIYTASNGKEAIDMIKHIHFDIVLMDHMMPEMDGIDTTKIIRSLDGEYYKKLPILALTANAVNGAKEMFLKEGMNDFISKPIEMRTLVLKLKHWLAEELLESSDEVIVSNFNDENSNYQLPLIKDLNTKLGFEMSGQTLENYTAILKIYFRNTPNQLELLENYLKISDLENYKIQVHGLKSASLNIGAENISSLAAELEQAAINKNIEIIKAKHIILTQLTNNLLDNIKVFIEQSEQNNDTETASLCEQSDSIISDLNSLFNAVDLFDSDTAIEIIDRIQAYSKKYSQLSAMLENTKKQLEDFEYNDAKKLAQETIIFMGGEIND